MSRCVPSGEVHILPVGVPANHKGQHQHDLQEMRTERKGVRQANGMRVLQYHRCIHRQQVSAMHQFRDQVWPTRQLRAVQTEVRI